MNQITEQKFEGYAIMELLGHRRLAGYVREATLAGAGVLRLDVPRLDATCWDGGTAPIAGEGQFTTFYSPASLYALTPVDGKTARAVARQTSVQPATRWEIEDDARALLEAAAEVKPAEAPAAHAEGGSIDGDAAVYERPPVVEPAPAPELTRQQGRFCVGRVPCCDFAGEEQTTNPETREPNFRCPKSCPCHQDMPF